MPTVYYITHPQVRLDPDTPVPDWSLSDVGVARLEAVAARPWVAAIETLVSSAEQKARQTADILCGARTDVVRLTRQDAHENDRSATGFVPPDQFELLADAFFAHPERSIQGWETAYNAQARIVAMVDAVLKQTSTQHPIAFTGHGGVGTLLLCALRGDAIAREHDQPAGGGNVFAFDSQSRAVHHGWVPLEDVEEV